MLSQKDDTTFTNIIDYAGLFPPASLELEESMKNFIEYKKSPDAHLLGRFLCPTQKLPLLKEYISSFRGLEPLEISLVAQVSLDSKQFLEQLTDELESITHFNIRYAPLAKVDSLEKRLPSSLKEPLDFCSKVQELISCNSIKNLNTYFEVSPDAKNYLELAKALAQSKQTLQNPEGKTPLSGLKLRCGGTKSSDFPSLEQVASSIVTCQQLKLPLKFTAGLHQPLRHFNEGLKVTEHGFVNVFVAGIMAWANALSFDEVLNILSETNPSSFSFDEGLAFQNFHVSLQDVIFYRKTAFPSFGSCSVAEPIDALKTLNWLKS